MPKAINEIGNIYGNFLVIEKDIEKTTQTKRAQWICECQKCKTKKTLSGTDLRSKKYGECPVCKNEAQQIKEIGNRYGHLTVISFDKKASDRHYFWNCQCDCGKIESISGTDLRMGTRTQCLECNKKNAVPQYINEKGKRYGQLLVLERDKGKSNKNAYWICQCNCGNIISVSGVKLRYGQKSCGCIKSKGEFKINQILSNNNIRFKTQVSYEDCKDVQLLRFDFGICNNKDEIQYLIEFDGKQHFKFDSNGWNDENHFLINQKHDNLKNQYCLKNNIPLIRIPYTRYEDLCIEDLLLETSQFIITK